MILDLKSGCVHIFNWCNIGLIRKYWWNPSKENNHYFSRMAWKDLCQSKKDGGLGFNSFSDFNISLLIKLARWILGGKKKGKFCIQALSAKYKVDRK